jgi:hypothetical protein
MWQASMERQVVISISVLLLFLMLFFAWNAKSAYRLLPANVTEPMPINPYANWREFISADGQYSVKFPDIAQHATDTVGQRFYDMTVAERANGTTFLVTRITFNGEKATEAHRSLESFRDEIVAAKPDNEVLDEHQETVAGHPALAFTLENAMARSNCLLFFVDNTLFMVMMISPKEFYRQQDADYYFRSFQLR